MSESTCRLFTFNSNLINPFHVLYVKYRNFTIILLIFEIRRAVISSKENKKHIVNNTRLFLFFWRVYTRNMRHSSPFLLCNIERVIILNNCFVMSTIDNDFISISNHIMKSSSIWQGLFSLGTGHLDVKLCERIIELTSTIAYNKWWNTSKDINIISYAAHRMTFYSSIR